MDCASGRRSGLWVLSIPVQGAGMAIETARSAGIMRSRSILPRTAGSASAACWGETRAHSCAGPRSNRRLETGERGSDQETILNAGAEARWNCRAGAPASAGAPGNTRAA